MFAHRGYLSIMIFLQEIASRKIFLGAYLALKFQKKHKNEIIRRKIRAKNTRRYEKHARKKNQKKFHRSLRIRRSGVRVPSGAPKACDIKNVIGFFSLLHRTKSAKSMTDFQSAFYRDVQPFSGGWTFLLGSLGQVSPPPAARFCSFSAKIPTFFCCFQNVFNFPAANFLLAAGIFCFFRQFSVCFQVFHFIPIYNKESCK